MFEKGSLTYPHQTSPLVCVIALSKQHWFLPILNVIMGSNVYSISQRKTCKSGYCRVFWSWILIIFVPGGLQVGRHPKWRTYTFIGGAKGRIFFYRLVSPCPTPLPLGLFCKCTQMIHLKTAVMHCESDAELQKTTLQRSFINNWQHLVSTVSHWPRDTSTLPKKKIPTPKPPGIDRVGPNENWWQ